MPRFEVGKVYKLNRLFSDREDGKDAKRRYFLYLGNSSEFLSNPIFVYVATSTTRLAQFADGEKRAGENFIRFCAGSYGFSEDCVVCLDDLKTYMTEPLFASYEPEEKGMLDEHMLRRVYEKILASKRISKKIKCDIHECFNKILSGLRMPR